MALYTTPHQACRFCMTKEIRSSKSMARAEHNNFHCSALRQTLSRDPKACASLKSLPDKLCNAGSMPGGDEADGCCFFADLKSVSEVLHAGHCPETEPSLHQLCLVHTRQSHEWNIVRRCRSLEAAVAAYEKAGGSANIFINDDGLQLINPEAQLRRVRFYRQHNIGCAALTHIFGYTAFQ